MYRYDTYITQDVVITHSITHVQAFKMPYHSFNPSYTGQAVGGNETFDLLWRSACQFVQRMEVKFLPVHKPTEAERKDATLYANNMQRLMASHLGMYSTHTHIQT